MKNESRGFVHLMKSTKYSLQGLWTAAKNESAFRQELLLFVVLAPVGVYIADTFLVWILLMVPLFTLLITELLNSALEAVVDRVGTEFHELSGKAKDMASAAVFMNILFLLVVWGGYLVYWFGVFGGGGQ